MDLKVKKRRGYEVVDVWYEIHSPAMTINGVVGEWIRSNTRYKTKEVALNRKDEHEKLILVVRYRKLKA